MPENDFESLNVSLVD